MALYDCIVDNQWGGRFYSKGTTYNISSTPPSEWFTAVADDDANDRVTNRTPLPAHRDAQGDWHIDLPVQFEKDAGFDDVTVGGDLNVECIQFNTEYVGTSAEGKMCWSADEDTFAVGMPGGNVNLNPGMEQFLPRRVNNKSGADMTNGQLVYISDGDGNNAEVSLAKADVAATAETTIAMLTEAIDDTKKGYATTFGLVRGIDTAGHTPGTILYLAADVAGGYTATLPLHPNYAVKVGQVFREHATEGSIMLNIEEPVCACKVAGGDRAVWDDLRFPFTAQRLDSASTRYSYDYFNCGVEFDADARYPNEKICMMVQTPHAALEGANIEPHIHWIQQGASMPNWLIAYRILKKNTDIGVQSDYSNYTFMPWSSNAFTYTSGDLHQITEFGTIDMTGTTFSDCLQIVLWRDTTNASGEFAGVDPSAISEITLEFDIHYEIDSLGSRLEYNKG